MFSFLGPGQQTRSLCLNERGKDCFGYTDYFKASAYSWLISNDPRLLPFFDTPTPSLFQSHHVFLHVLIRSGRSATSVRHAVGQLAVRVRTRTVHHRYWWTVAPNQRRPRLPIPAFAGYCSGAQTLFAQSIVYWLERSFRPLDTIM